MSIDVPSYQDDIYTNSIADITKMQDFKAGLKKVVKRLSKWEMESVKGHESRQTNATLFNSTKKTITTAAGMLFRKPIELSGLDDLFMDKISNIDNAQSSLNTFMKDTVNSALWDGISYILVDMPKNDVQLSSLKQQLELGIIPYFTKIEASQVINRTIENNVLTQVTIEENITVKDGRFSEKTSKQYRVLTIGGWEIFSEDGAKTDDGLTGLSYIPLVPVYTNRTGYLQASPPFLDIADLNLKHFNFQSQLDKTLFIAANPIPKMWGARSKGDNVVIGVDQAMRWDDKDAGDFEWEEFTGTSVDKLQGEIERTEKRMATMGLSILTENNTARTATEVAIEASSDTSELSTVAIGSEQSLMTAYVYWCDMMNRDAKGTIETNKDFIGIALTPEQAAKYLDMYSQGTITLDQLWNELQRGEFIQKFDREEAKARLEADNQNVDI